MSEKEPHVSGICDSKFEQVKETFIKNFTQHSELGASVCVYKDGEKVVNCTNITIYSLNFNKFFFNKCFFEQPM